MSESRAWDEIDWHKRGPAWILAMGFGASGTRRVVLRYGIDAWVIHYAQPDGSTWVSESGGDIAGCDIDPRDVDAAQRWALTELATIARDLAQRYAGQSYQLMSELVRPTP
jgi:hypothetical protein